MHLVVANAGVDALPGGGQRPPTIPPPTLAQPPATHTPTPENLHPAPATPTQGGAGRTAQHGKRVPTGEDGLHFVGARSSTPQAGGGGNVPVHVWGLVWGASGARGIGW